MVRTGVTFAPLAVSRRVGAAETEWTRTSATAARRARVEVLSSSMAEVNRGGLLGRGGRLDMSGGKNGRETQTTRTQKSATASHSQIHYPLRLLRINIAKLVSAQSACYLRCLAVETVETAESRNKQSESSAGPTYLITVPTRISDRLCVATPCLIASVSSQSLPY